MKFLIKSIFTAVISFGILAVYSCSETEKIADLSEIAVATVTATPENIVLAVGEIRALKAEVTPVGASQEIYWKSANPDIVTVANGIITGVSEGETVVTVNSIIDASKKDEVRVTVVRAAVAVDSIFIEIDRVEENFYLGDELPIRSVVHPANASNKEVLWQNSNPEVAVIENGILKCLARGTTRITILSGSNVNVSFSVDVTVTDRSVPVEDIVTSHTRVALAAGKSQTVSATVAPDDATNKTLVWETSDAAVATVSEGVITAHSIGTAVVTVSSEAYPDVQTAITVDVPNLSSLLPLFAETAGLWFFDDPAEIAKSTLGNGLKVVNGDNPIVRLDGASAVVVPKGSHFIATGIAPNGGGDNVNEYTLMIDFRQPTGGKWYSFFQTNLANSDDAECFINTSNKIGVGTPGYSETAVESSKWYRLVVAFKGGVSYDIYLDGVNIFTTAADKLGSISVDSRFSLSPDGVILIGDNDGDDADIEISGIAIWDKTLTASEISSLGVATTP